MNDNIHMYMYIGIGLAKLHILYCTVQAAMCMSHVRASASAVLPSPVLPRSDSRLPTSDFRLQPNAMASARADPSHFVLGMLVCVHSH
jgi:hypothetical protein